MSDDAERIAELGRRRVEEHRVTSHPMRDVRQVKAFVRDRRIVLDTGKAAIPNLADAISGRVLSGSWMANPEVYLIYRLLSRLDGFFSAPLILGKGTTLDRELAAMVHSVAIDPGRREAAVARLSPTASHILELVDQHGDIRGDSIGVSTKEARKARQELEQALLVRSYEIHTQEGSHASIVAAWTTSKFATEFGGRSLATLDRATDVLVEAGIRSAVIAPEREVRKWLDGSAAALDRLLDAGALMRLRDGKQSHVALA